MKIFILIWFVLLPSEAPLMGVQTHFSEQACQQAAIERGKSLKPAYDAGEVVAAGFKCVKFGVSH